VGSNLIKPTFFCNIAITYIKLNRENITCNKKIYYPLQNTGDCAVKTLIIPLYYLGLKYYKFENEENVLNNFLHFINIIRLDIFNNHINIDEITDISRQQLNHPLRSACGGCNGSLFLRQIRKRSQPQPPFWLGG
jgi:hypothetical protein